MKKKFTLTVLAFTCLMGMPLHAQTGLPPTASKEIYDFKNFEDKKMLDLFYDAIKAGKMFPSEEDFVRIGISKADLAFVRSHVRKHQILDRDGRLLTNTFKDRNLWMNTPMGSGNGGDAGYPSSVFSSDVFSLWNYTNLWGSWNHGIFQAPGAWVDAAHKNGTDMMTGIKFFDTTGGRGQTADVYKEMITTKDVTGYDGFKYVKPFIHLLLFLGHDGININWEDGSPSDNDVVKFHQALYKYANSIGFNNFHMGLYTMSSSLSNYNSRYLFGDSNGRTADLMLNYGGWAMGTSVQEAKKALGTADGLYQGYWISGMNHSWSNLSATQEIGICLWGEHKMSRFWQHNKGTDAFDAQKNYQYLLERAFSGGNRNPMNLPAVTNQGHNWEAQTPLSNFPGFATWIPERSTVQGKLPFVTNFNLGNGERYNYKGKKTAGSYYNMSSQDIVPTYRWLVCDEGTTTASSAIEVGFSHKDSYIGGSCLELKGDATKATDIVLYRTELTPNSGNVYAKVALKYADTDTKHSNLYVIVRLKNSQWKEYAVSDNTGTMWQEHKIDLTGISASDVIDRIGLRVKGGEANYDMYVGKLEINDDHKQTPANIKDLSVDVKEETTSSMSLKLNWDVDATTGARAQYGMIFNDDANIDHFEILYKNGENGKVSEIARTTQWATYIGNIPLKTDEKPVVGVRAVSTDLKTYSPVVWYNVERGDQSKLPVVEEEDTYGVSKMNPNCEGAAVARKVRYLTSVKTSGASKDINYTASGPQTDGTQYVKVANQTLEVAQGQKFTLTFKAYEATKATDGNEDDLRWCFAGGWIDFDGSGTFNHPLGVKPQLLTGETVGDGTDPFGERIFKLGAFKAKTMTFVQGNGVTAEIEIPQDAHVGKSRLRIVFSDAWFAGEFLPVGLHNKGFSIDFDVMITGNEAGQRVPYDSHDQGVADEPEGLTTTGINSVSDGASTVNVSNGAVNFGNVDKAWIYSVDGSLVKVLVNPVSVSLKDFGNGVYIVKMQSGNNVQSKKLVIR